MAALHISASLPLLLLLLLLPLLTLLLFSGRRRTGNAAWKLPPGPNTLPIIGNLHQLGRSLLHQSLWELSKQHGPVMRLKLGRVPAVVVSSAGSAEQVLRTHDLQCCSRPRTISTAKLSFGGSDVAFSPYGSHWRHLRKVCVAELFTTKKTTSFRPVRGRGPENRGIDPTAFGGRCPDGFHRMAKECQAIFSTFFVADYFAMLGWVDVIRGTQARLQDVFLELDAFYRRLIDDHLDPRRRRSDDGEDTLDALLRLHKDDSNITDAHIKGVLMNIFVAGSDTSASGVEWAMTELMRHPEKLRRARDEVRGCVGRKAKVEESELHQLAYLKCVVKETLRLHPPAPLLVARDDGAC
ncbi:cytochrome P450 [Musa troglodytarum]|uniref:Cytochrome P450 n=1 Tax=Musa troglodytarum TaxID=320322 RepID=A0A9E7KCR0_9LILI|nr:cytochrome P450 [Musa troglodytarum]